MIDIRVLDDAGLEQAWEIDVSEEGGTVYAVAGGALEARAERWRRPRWDADEWAAMVDTWRRTLRPDVWVGAFDGERLVGLASLRYRLRPSTAQLTTLHVDRAHRRRGVAQRLLEHVLTLAEADAARALYVSATPSESAVGFYLRNAFEPTLEPDPGQFALEPEDVHLIRPVAGAGSTDRS